MKFTLLLWFPARLDMQVWQAVNVSCADAAADELQNKSLSIHHVPPNVPTLHFNEQALPALKAVVDEWFRVLTYIQS